MQAKDEDFGLEAAEGPESVEGSKAKAGLPWDGSDRDYTYEELLGERGWERACCTGRRPGPSPHMLGRARLPVQAASAPSRVSLAECSGAHSPQDFCPIVPSVTPPTLGPCLPDRVFGILKENNPELTGERRRTTLKPPQVAREGTKKTVFTNFMELCKSMNRNHEHVQAFLLAELGTSGGCRGVGREGQNV